MNAPATTPRRIFVSGATGVLGHRLVPLLTAAGHRVTAAGRTPEKRAMLERAGATAIEIDLFDPAAAKRAVEGHQVVINLATHIPPSAHAFVPGAWRENDRVRRTISANLATAALAAGVGRMVQESFAPIYEDAGEHWIGEDAPVRVARSNRSVLDAEASADRISRAGGAGVILRFSYLYGAESDFTMEAIRFVARGGAPVLGLPSAFISCVSLDDAASAVVAALSLPAGRFNVTDDRPVTRREFADSLAAALGVAAPQFFPGTASLPGSLSEMLSRSQRISNARLRSLTGWAPRYPSVVEGWPAVGAELAEDVPIPTGREPWRSREATRSR